MKKQILYIEDGKKILYKMTRKEIHEFAENTRLRIRLHPESEIELRYVSLTPEDIKSISDNIEILFDSLSETRKDAFFPRII